MAQFNSLWLPGAVVGLEMAGMIFSRSSPYKKLEDANNPRASWIFKGTKEGNTFGAYGIDKVRGGAAGFEIDKYNPGDGVPRHARSPAEIISLTTLVWLHALVLTLLLTLSVAARGQCRNRAN